MRPVRPSPSTRTLRSCVGCRWRVLVQYVNWRPLDPRPDRPSAPPGPLSIGAGHSWVPASLRWCRGLTSSRSSPQVLPEQLSPSDLAVASHRRIRFAAGPTPQTRSRIPPPKCSTRPPISTTSSRGTYAVSQRRRLGLRAFRRREILRESPLVRLPRPSDVPSETPNVTVVHPDRDDAGEHEHDDRHAGTLRHRVATARELGLSPMLLSSRQAPLLSGAAQSCPFHGWSRQGTRIDTWRGDMLRAPR